MHNLETFAGKRIIDYTPEESIGDLAQAIPRLRVEYEAEETVADLLRELLQSGEAERLTGLSIGVWSSEMYDDQGSPAATLEALVASADQLPQLRALFIGDIARDEFEVSWIQQCDLSALWDAFPRLEYLGIRGGNGLSLGKLRLNHLRELTIEAGGLPANVLAELAAASLPVLERLELYLGTKYHGWDGTIDDVLPLHSGEHFPKLKHLGLRDSEIADDIAEAVAQSPLVQRLESLDLSLGTLGDRGAAALLASDAIKRLKKVDLRHNYISKGFADQFANFGPEVDVSGCEGDEDEDERYVAVGE